MINIIWAGMFVIAVFTAFIQLIISHDAHSVELITKAIFSNASVAVNISIGLIGILCFWLGILKIIEETGIAENISYKLTPLFNIIMKDIPKNSPAISTVVLNMSANFLGLDNAATPMGLKAMKQLQEHNKKKDEASDAQILFMILNSSSITFIPITIFMYRAQMGATYPTDVFIPILLATSVSTIVGFLLVAIKQRIPLGNITLLKWFGCFALIIALLSFFFLNIELKQRLVISSAMGNIILLSLLTYVIIISIKKKIKTYETFVEGAKDGFNIAIQILPYLVAMLVIIGVFRASGVLDYVINGIKHLCTMVNVNSDFVDALPTAIMKPLSGSGARAMMIETMQNFGADSFSAFVASIIQGSTETTFYVLTVYFGAVRISKTRYALKYALLSDLSGIIAAIVFSYMFYKN